MWETDTMGSELECITHLDSFVSLSEHIMSVYNLKGGIGTEYEASGNSKYDADISHPQH